MSKQASHNSTKCKEWSEHLHYECELFLDCWKLVRASRESGWLASLPNRERDCLKNAVLESALLHSRVLYDFFFDKVQPATTSEDIVPSSIWTVAAARGRMPVDLHKIHRRLAHLTTDRTTTPDWDPAVWMKPLLDPIIQACDACKNESLDSKDWKALRDACDKLNRDPGIWRSMACAPTGTGPIAPA